MTYRVGVTFSFNNKLKIKQVVYGLSAFLRIIHPAFPESVTIKISINPAKSMA